MQPLTDDERRATFDYYLRRAIFFGERHEVSCVGLTGQTWNAIAVVAQAFPNVTIDSIMLARSTFERQLDGTEWKEQMAVRQAAKAGLIPYRTEYVNWVATGRTPAGKRKIEYRPEYLTIGFADPDAAQAWIEANRENPSDIYRECGKADRARSGTARTLS